MPPVTKLHVKAPAVETGAVPASTSCPLGERTSIVTAVFEVVGVGDSLPVIVTVWFAE